VEHQPYLMLAQPNPNHNVIWSGLPPKPNGFFQGPLAIFPRNSVQISWIVLRNLANKNKERKTERQKERKKERMNERKNEWMNERMKEWKNERMKEWKNEWMNEWKNE